MALCLNCRRVDIDAAYIEPNGNCGECNERLAEDNEVDDDPRCICGTYRSEHRLCGCAEGFVSADQWMQEKKFIGSLDDLLFDTIFGRGY